MSLLVTFCNTGRPGEIESAMPRGAGVATQAVAVSGASARTTSGAPYDGYAVLVAEEDCYAKVGGSSVIAAPPPGDCWPLKAGERVPVWVEAGEYVAVIGA